MCDAITAQAFAVVAAHKVAGAKRGRRFVEKLSVRARDVKGVMLHDEFLSPQNAKHERSERRTGDVDEVSLLNQLFQTASARRANHGEGLCGVFAPSAFFLCRDGDFDLFGSCVSSVPHGESAREFKYDRLRAARLWHVEIGINEQSHARS